MSGSSVHRAPGEQPRTIASQAIRWADLQSEKPFNADVLGQLKQCVKALVLTQWFAIDFDSEC
jgi:hypothetical protein